MSDQPLVSSDIESALTSFVMERGGQTRFLDYQLDAALTFVTLMRDSRNESLAPAERKAAALAAVAFLNLCPAPPPPPPPPPKDPSLIGLSVTQLSRIYERMVAGIGDAAEGLFGRPDPIEEPTPAEPARAPAPVLPPPVASAPDLPTPPPPPEPEPQPLAPSPRSPT